MGLFECPLLGITEIPFGWAIYWCRASTWVSSMPANDSAWMHWLDRSGAGKAERQRYEQPGQTKNTFGDVRENDFLGFVLGHSLRIGHASPPLLRLRIWGNI
jgi:hypothetical protein